MQRLSGQEILNSRSDNEQLKPDGSDFKLIKSLLEFHPSGPGKSAGLVGIKVGKSQQGDSRCSSARWECLAASFRA